MSFRRMMSRRRWLPLGIVCVIVLILIRLYSQKAPDYAIQRDDHASKPVSLDKFPNNRGPALHPLDPDIQKRKPVNLPQEPKMPFAANDPPQIPRADPIIGEKFEGKPFTNAPNDKRYQPPYDPLHYLKGLRDEVIDEEVETRKYEQLTKDLEPLRKKLFYGKTPKDFSVYQMNATHSDTLPLDRSIPDTRSPGCADEKWETRLLPRASIVMPFYNEPWSMLLRAVHSALSRGPPALIEELILVDDFSDMDYLRGPMEEYVRNLPKVKLIRTAGRSGLMRARMFGANHAKSDVLVFLDAHVECNKYWLAPLLNEIYKNRQAAVMSSLDNIDENLIRYTGNGHHHNRLLFDFKMQELWAPVPETVLLDRPSSTHPIVSPGMSGSVLAIARDYFFRLGGYDEGMDIWGAENIELAFRIWMCGGQLYIHPCSRVGHVFRSWMPYNIPTDTLQKNRIRVAELWTGKYRKYFYAATDATSGAVRLKDSEMVSLQKRKDYMDTLQCKSFDWFLQHVAVDVYVPPPTTLYMGQIMHQHKRVWRYVHDGEEDYITIAEAYISEPGMLYYLQSNGVIGSHGKCVTYKPSNMFLTLGACDDGNIERSVFYYDKQKRLQHRFTGKYAVHMTSASDKQVIMLMGEAAIKDWKFGQFDFTFHMNWDTAQDKLVL